MRLEWGRFEEKYFWNRARRSAAPTASLCNSDRQRPRSRSANGARSACGGYVGWRAGATICHGVTKLETDERAIKTMYSKPIDVVEAALRFLKEADTLRTPQNQLAFNDHVLAAAVLANHVLDWHTRQFGRKGTAAFKRRYVSHIDINDISNGVKHPFAGHADVATGHIRRVEWEDIDFWTTADFEAPTLFINDKKGTSRSVEALVSDFCREYLANEAAGIHAKEAK
jgi:hypothetical protein